MRLFIWNRTPEEGCPASSQILCQKLAVCLSLLQEVSFQPTSVREDVLECGIHLQAQSSREETNFLAYESRVSIRSVQLGTTQVKTSGGNSGMVEETIWQYRSISAREALDQRIRCLR